MTAYFFDTSALTKRYVAEIGSGWMQSLMLPAAQNTFYVARITLVELVSAITRRKKNGDLSNSAAAAALADLRSTFDSSYEVVEVTAALVSKAELLAEKHALRGYDAVQLAATLHVHSAFVASHQPPPVLVSADVDLNAAASAEGLTVEDPNTH